MFSIFTSSAADAHEPLADKGEEKFSRFETTEGSVTALRKIGKLTRFDPQHDVELDYNVPAKRVVPKRPARLVQHVEIDPLPETQQNIQPIIDATPNDQPINETAHLHEDGEIPLWVIKNALPGRFSGVVGGENDLYAGEPDRLSVAI